MGDDAGVAHVHLGGVHGHLGLQDLRLQPVHVGQRQVVGGLGRFQVGTRPRVGGKQLFLPLQGQRGLRLGGLLGTQLGLHVGQGGLGVALGVLLRHRVDLGDQLAGLDLVTQCHMEHLDLPRHLGAYAHLFKRLQHTRGEHGVLQVGGGGSGGNEGRRLRSREELPFGHGAQDHQAEGNGDPAEGVFTCHGCGVKGAAPGGAGL